MPKLGRCLSDGETYQEAITNVEIIIEKWIETAKLQARKIPKPKGKLIYT